MKRLSMMIFGLVLTGSLCSGPVIAGGRFFLGIEPAPFWGPPGAVFFGSRHFNDRFIVNFGARGVPPFFHGPALSGYYYPPAMSAPYSNAAGEVSRQGFSGTDSSGALYIDGYRVMPSGWLRVQVEPSDAIVLIDGFPAAVDPTHGTSKSIGLPVGSHQVEVYQAGSQKFQSEVEVKQAREVFLRIKLDE